MKAHIRTVNRIIYSDEFSYQEEPDELRESIDLLSEDYGENLIVWNNEKDFDMEIHYNYFIDAMNTKYIKERHGEILERLLKEVLKSEDSKNNGFIRIDWF